MTAKKSPIKIGRDGNVRDLPLDSIFEPENPDRSSIAVQKVNELAASIKQIGLQSPIKVRPKGEGYEIVFGHRRYLAHKSLGKQTIKSIIQEMSDEEVSISRAVENLQREDLSPYEEAQSLMGLQENYNLTNKQIAQKLGYSEAWVSQRLAVQHYSPLLKAALAAGDITFSVARLLDRIKDPNYLKLYLRNAIENGATPKVVERWVSDLRLESMPQFEDIHDVNPSAPIEDHIAPTERCYFSGKNFPYSQMTQIWVNKQTLRDVIDIIVNYKAHEENAGE